MPSVDAAAPVVVAGAGPVGLSLALGLARAGVRSVIYEKEATLPPHARAAIVWPRTLEIFHGWGVRDAIAARGMLLPHADISDADDNRTILAFDFMKILSPETLEPAPVTIAQDETEAVLYDVLMQTRMCEVHFNHEVLGLTQDAGGVSARVRDAGGIETEVRAQFLVGADGAHGHVRGALGMTLEGITYPVRVMLVDIALEDERNALPSPRFSLTRRSPMGAIRFSPTRWRLIVTLQKDETDEVALSANFINARVETLVGAGGFRQDWASVFDIHRRRVKTFVVGRVALAGDAAHLNSPAGGQGMNAGIADAQNLAWKLAAALRGGNVSTLLASYDEERGAAFSEGVEKLTDRMTRMVLMSSPLVRRAGLRILPLIARLPNVRRRMVRAAAMVDLRYTHSPILFGHSPLLGARAPDPALACGGTVATLVTYRVPKQLSDAASIVLKVRVKPLERREAKRWGMGRSFAALVRPDGIVGWIAPNPQPDEIEAQVRAALGYNVPSGT